jgi:transcriptional regulator with XRE-family HTH domain
MLGINSVTPQIAFGRVLRDLRKSRGLSQEALAYEAEVQRNFVSLIERGQNQPSISTLWKLAGALHVQPSVVIEKVEKMISEQASA